MDRRDAWVHAVMGVLGLKPGESGLFCKSVMKTVEAIRRIHAFHCFHMRMVIFKRQRMHSTLQSATKQICGHRI
jgi:hypothetical protein